MKVSVSRKLVLMLGGGGLLVVSAIGCSNSDDSNESGFGDASVPLDASSADATGAEASLPIDASPGGGEACTSNTDCPSTEFVCVYPIADHCTATGVCKAIPQPACQSAIVGCSCDGGVAYIPCYFTGPDGDGVGGYATAPVIGSGLSGCQVDAGADAGDAGDAGDGGDSGS